MITFDKNKKYIILISSYLFSCLILNRWVFTDMREMSFGRLWQYYSSWTDFGFFRRGLLGTFLDVFKINSIVSNEYVFAYLFTFTLLTILYIITFRIIESRQEISENFYLYFIIFFSPATFTHFAKETGNFDIPIVLLFLISTFYIKNTFSSAFILSVGIFMHESMIFFLPCSYLFKSFIYKLRFKDYISVCLPVLSIIIILLYGETHHSKEYWDNIMQNKIPIGYDKHILWSGYFEVSSSISSNNYFKFFIHDNIIGNWYWMIIPNIYLFYLSSLLFLKVDTSFKKRIIILLSTLFPYLIVIVAKDYYRWVSFCVMLSLFAILLLIDKKKLSLSNNELAFISSFSIFMPFGGVPIDRPFPLHQFILEKVIF